MQQFRASDGTAIAYEDVGEGRPLVLLHGLMAHSGFFARQRELASEFRLVNVDLRGHGASSIDRKAATIADLARDIDDIAAALDLHGAIGIGWSLGASVLWELLGGPAADRFAGAVIVDMTPRVLNEDGWELGLSQDACDARTQAIRSDFTAFAQNAGQAIFAQPVRPELRQLAEWAGAEFARNDPAAIDSIWSSLVEADYRPALPSIHQPTLIVRGAQSQLYGPGTAEHLATALPNARCVRFDHSGHAPQLEQPDLFNRTIRNFAAGLPQIREQQATAF